MTWTWTYLFVVNDDSLAVFDADAKGRLDPALPEHAVDPGKLHFLALNVVHVDPDAFCRSQTALVVSVFCLLDSELLCVAQFLSLELEGLSLFVDPVSYTHLTLPTIYSV